MVEDGGMTGRIFAILIDPRIQARVVILVDFFVIDGLVIQADGFGSPSVERVARIQRCLEVQVGDEGGHVGITLLEADRTNDAGSLSCRVIILNIRNIFGEWGTRRDRLGQQVCR